MIDLALSKSGLWHSIEDCLEKTDNLYDDVISSIDKMTQYSETITSLLFYFQNIRND